MTELRELIEEASRIADVAFKPDGVMLAHILTITPEGTKHLIACQMGAGDEERLFRIAFPRRLQAAGHQRWVFFCEAWMAAYLPGESPVGSPPKERRERVEVVTFSAAAGSGETMSASRQIWRDGRAGSGRLLPLVFADAPPQYVIADQQQERTVAHD